MSDAIRRFADLAGGELAAQGFPRVPARILTALTASEAGRLTAGELAQVLELSAAAVSGGIRYLTGLGFVRVGTIPGTRRHVYSLTETPWYTLGSLGDRYERAAAAFGAAEEALPRDSAARARAAEMTSFMRFCAERVPALMAEWERSRGISASPES